MSEVWDEAIISNGTFSSSVDNPQKETEAFLTKWEPMAGTWGQSYLPLHTTSCLGQAGCDHTFVPDHMMSNYSCFKSCPVGILT